MDLLGGFIKTVTKPRFEEDFVDRINYQYTVWVLGVFAMFISAKEYFGEPIQCWVPAEFSGAWEQYVESYCFVESTYYVALHQDLNTARNAPDGPPRISYYQWVPFVLALQALMFFLPHMLWRLLNWQSGVNIRGVISMACDKNIGKDKFEGTVLTIAGHMKKAIDLEDAVKGGQTGNPLHWIFGLGRASGFFVNYLYLFVKTLFVINIIAQFFILKDFLGIKSDFWGAEIFSDLISGKTWNNTGNFPRVTFCDFKIRVMGNMQDRTVQCVLTINMFAEKIYLFVWWWFLFVAIITVMNFLYWIVISFSSSSRETFVKNLLLLGDRSFEEPPKANNIRNFVKTLRPDGVFVLRLMCKNAGDLITYFVLKNLYKEMYPDPPAQTKVSVSSAPAPANMRVSYEKNLDTAHTGMYPTAPVQYSPMQTKYPKHLELAQ